MGKDKEERNESTPLLYIQQPKLDAPQKYMQESFYSYGEESEDKEVVEVKEETEIIADEQNTATSVKLEKEEQEKPMSAIDYFRSKSKSTGSSWRLNPIKSFVQMTLEEKLRYLASFSSEQPPYPCLFVTIKGNYKGVLNHYNGEQLSIKTIQDEVVKINTEELQEIRIII